MLQVVSQDVNYDGKPDTFTVTATVAAPFPVTGARLLVQFFYVLNVRPPH
jgi:hypothetical protein